MSNEFSWERYKAGEKVTTRSGAEILHIEKCVDNCDCLSPFAAIQKSSTGCLNLRYFWKDGRKFENEDHPDDLVMAPKIMDLYIFINKEEDSFGLRGTSFVYYSLEDIKDNLKNDLHKHIFKITVNTDTWEQVL